MLGIFQKWYERYFFEEESILLLVLLALALLLLVTIGEILSPTVGCHGIGLLVAGD